MNIPYSTLKCIFTGKTYLVGFPEHEQIFIDAVDETMRFQQQMIRNTERSGDSVLGKSLISYSDISVSSLTVPNQDNTEAIGLDFISMKKCNKLLWEENFLQFSEFKMIRHSGLETVKIPMFPTIKITWNKVISKFGERCFSLCDFVCEYENKQFICLSLCPVKEKRHIMEFTDDPDKKSIYINSVVNSTERTEFETQLVLMVEEFLTEKLLQIGWTGTEEFTI